ncbi:tetratricopeptide repeat protein [Crocinitomix catalasitica]|uniref:tetratricopeptide repeat protein n=1 Tax=Crocinitomix catalasitica TaxID=184607 RepID=UPI0004833F02|nr:LuxR family transcriptional regulator [Crocinitomix catalasitica]
MIFQKQICLYIALLFSAAIWSNETELDSLKRQYHSASEDKIISSAYDLSHWYIGRDSILANDYLQLAMELSKKTNNVHGVMRGNLEYAYLQTTYGQPHLAIETVFNLLKQTPKFTLSDSIRFVDILSISLEKLGVLDLAINYRKEHLDLISGGEKKQVYYTIENLAYLNTTVELYDSANYYYNKALKIAIELKDPSLLMHCNNNIAHNLKMQGQDHEALKKYENAIEFYTALESPNQTDSLLFAIILGNIGSLELSLGKMHAAQENLEASTNLIYDLNRQGNHDSLHFGFYQIKYAELEIELGNFKAAENKLLLAFNNLQHAPNLLVDYYRVLIHLYEKTNRTDKASQALKRLVLVRDRIEQQKMVANFGINGLVKFQLENLKTSYQLLSESVAREKASRKVSTRLLILVYSLLFIIVLILFLIYRAKQKKKTELLGVEKNKVEKRLAVKSKESSQLSIKLDNKDNDLTDFAIDLRRKQSFNKDLLNRLTNLSSSNQIEIDLKALISDVRSELFIDKNLKFYQENIDKINHEFKMKLLQLYPSLTQNEQQLCAMLRLGLTTKEIATVKGISPASVKVLRHRIRKKMHLKAESNLVDLLKSVS